MRSTKQHMAYVKDSKIPFYEKLPKESEYYKHYMQSMYMRSISEVALE